MYFNLYNLLIFFGVGQGLILGLLILLIKREGGRATIFLALLIISFALTSGKHLVIDLKTQNAWLAPLRLPLSFFLLMGPLLYLYIKSTVFPQLRMSLRDWLHFLPPFIFLVLQLGVFLSEAVFPDANLAHLAFLLQLTEQIAGLLSFFVYGYLGLQLVKEYQRWITQEYSNHEYITLAWLQKLLVALLISWLLLFGFTLIDLVGYQFHLPPSAYYPLLLYVSVLIYWIGLKQLLRIHLPKSTINHSHKSELVSTEHLENLQDEIDRLKTFVSQQKPYLDPELKLDKLASLLSMHPKALSHLLNQGLHTSFYDFINYHRVEEIKKKLIDSQYAKYTLLGIALESGFNSKSTFNHIFKKFTRHTPMEYKKKHSYV
ncbi:AraC-like DNA-binding protein [Catalinimonas alkaloidigena]|uniref:AraC family transcriptional regulator n=1 Tax=Catalinimonas alkaloidigena TaxID=1075417 RepID=UPI0024067D02|nr:helix-turn-helix domain-containing protein [Catalinimonas alkaloidigena]MDF9800590.1 AraC-like DNA-binding protein [Catalinimonas alkaloidigena]